MVKTFKIIIFILLVVLFSFLIFRNFRNVDEVVRMLPTVEELDKYNSVSIKNEANIYELKDISDKQLITIYYTDFKNEVFNYPEEIYQKIRNKDEITYEIFSNFRNELINNYYTNKVEDYKIVDQEYTIENNYNQKIIFYVDSVLNYEIKLIL